MPDNEPKTINTSFESELTSECLSDGTSRTRTGSGTVSISRTITGDASSDDINININDNDLIDLTHLPEGFDLDSLPNEDISGSFNTDEITKNVVIHDDYTVTGDGIFDNLMETATKHLIAQFNAGRIRGEDYATDYAEIYKATLQAVTSLWATIPEIKSKILLAKAQAMLARAQAITAIAKSKYALVLAKSEYALAVAQAKEAESKVETAQLQSILTTEQAKLTAAQVCETEAKIEELKAQTDHIKVNDNLVAAQIKEEEAKRRLLNRQAEGFGEDYKQKILKMLLDSWQVMYTTAYDGFDTTEEARDAMPNFISAPVMDEIFTKYIKDELDYNIKSNPYAETDFMQTPPTVISERGETIRVGKKDSEGNYIMNNNDTPEDTSDDFVETEDYVQEGNSWNNPEQPVPEPTTEDTSTEPSNG